MLIQLPNGLLDGVDLFNYADVDELRGKQQNYLVNKELVLNNIGHIPKILEDLVKSLQTKEGLTWAGDMKEAIYKLPSGDIETILFKIRENTYGSRFYHEAVCTHCEHLNKDLRIDLDKLEIDVMNIDGMMNKASRTTKLPRTGKEVELRPLYLKDMFEALKFTISKQDELITHAVALSIKRIDDNMKVTSKDIEDFPSADIAHLNDVVANMKLEGSIDTDIINECSKCHKEFTSKLNPYEPSFFSPTRGSKSTRI